MAWVYILQGSNRRFYIGYSADLARRLEEHRRGSCHTTKRLGGEVELVISVPLNDESQARILEKKLKAMKSGVKAVEYLKRHFPTQGSPD